MEKEIKETLEIKNFLSIKNITWEVSDFNVLTGEMASGKSLCIKLLKFFEDIIPDLMSSTYNSFYRNLDIKNLYGSLKEKIFTNIFYFARTDNNNLTKYKVIYTFSTDKENFRMTVSGSNKADTKFECAYLENLLEDWKDDFDNDKSLDPKSASLERFSQKKYEFHKRLMEDFCSFFPMRTIFIPASRAALMSSSSHIDEYLSDYQYFLKFLPRYESRKLPIEKILKAKIKDSGGSYFLESNDNRRVLLQKGSSGQQEIATILLLLDKLGNFKYSYGNNRSVIIEGLAAHIFPADQKEIIELIVKVFRDIKGDQERSPIRFFLTINSLIMLDCLNNMLKKGLLLEKHDDKRAEIEKLAGFPALYINEITANFIDSEGNMSNIISKTKSKKIITNKIAKVIGQIKKDAKKLKSFSP
jgi:hypothetical protein